MHIAGGGMKGNFIGFVRKTKRKKERKEKCVTEWQKEN